MSKLFKNDVEYSRITPEMRPALIESITSHLDDLYAWNDVKFFHKLFHTAPEPVQKPWTKIEANKELAFKEDYGDLDLLMLSSDENYPINYFYEWLKSLKPVCITKASNNHNCTSFLFSFIDGRKFHVDVTFCKNELQFNNHKVYYCNSIVNNFMGQFLKSYNIKAGHNGIFYLYKDKRGDTIRIPIEEDYSKFFMDYFGMDLLTLDFPTYESMMDFLVHVPFFPGTRRYQEHRSSDKKRALKLHGLMNQVYHDLCDLSGNLQDNNYELQLTPEHQAIIDRVSAQHELLKDVNKMSRDAVFKFVEEQGIPQEQYPKIFEVLMPILRETHYSRMEKN